MNENLIHHNHLLIRMELIKFPIKKDIKFVKNLCKKIISLINMKLLGKPNIYYLDEQIENEGITGTCSIETSHLSFHIWNSPEKEILQNKKSIGLLQFDIYTCGILTKEYIKIILKNLKIFIPTRINIDVLDRKKNLKIKYSEYWNDNGKISFEKWINLKF